MSHRIACVALACQLGVACTNGTSAGVSVEAAEVALSESALTAQVDALVADAADRSSHFDIGQDLAAAALQLEGQLAEQLPCAQILREGNAVRIVHDATASACTSRGRNLSGLHTVRIVRNADNEVAVHHEWTELQDTNLSLSGSADVTWSRTSRSRRVVHELSFEVLDGPSAGRTGHSSGDSTHTTLADGVRLNGLRHWSSDRGTYALEMRAVEQRFADAVPEAGAYELTTPTDESLTLAFGRIDADNIRVIIQGAQKLLSFVVRADGSIEP